MPKEIKVKVRKHPQIAKALEVVDGGAIKVPKNDFHTIRWEIDTGSLPGGKFEPVGIAAAGFAWISSPPAGAFSSPWVSMGGEMMSIENYFTAGSNVWIYLLRVRVGQDVYATSVPLDPPSAPGDGKRKQSATAIRTTTNPIIINR